MYRKGYTSAVMVAFACLTLVGSAAPAGDGFPGFRRNRKQTAERSGAGSRDKWSQPVAIVDGEEISLKQLAEELVETYGKEQLDNMIHRKVIEQECREQKIEIGNDDINRDLAATCEKHNLSRKQFVETVLERRNLTLGQYVRETVWPALALKALVEKDVKVTEDDLNKAFEANFGEKVEVRMLIVHELKRAQDIWEATKKIEDLNERQKEFERHCILYSVDTASRSLGGKVAPIHRHYPFPDIEKSVFTLKPGEMTAIKQVPNGHLIFYCVGRVPPNKEVTFETVYDAKTKQTLREALTADIEGKRLREVAAEYYLRLRKKAVVDNFLTGERESERKKPGTVAPALGND